MEESETINSGLSAIRQIVPLFRSLLDKAPQQGASEDFTRQLNEAVITMQQAVIDAQEIVLESQARETKLRARLKELEQRTLQLDKWTEEISHYKLVNLPRNGGTAYVLRDEHISEEKPKHLLCTNCAEDGQKSILQYTGMTIKPYDCPRCNR